MTKEVLEKILYSSPACIPAKESFYSQKKDIFMNPLALPCHARLGCQGQTVQNSRESGQGAGGEQGHGPSRAAGGQGPPPTQAAWSKAGLPFPDQAEEGDSPLRERAAQFSLWVGGAPTGLAGPLRQKAEGRLSPPPRLRAPAAQVSPDGDLRPQGPSGSAGSGGQREPSAATAGPPLPAEARPRPARRSPPHRRCPCCWTGLAVRVTEQPSPCLPRWP